MTCVPPTEVCTESVWATRSGLCFGLGGARPSWQSCGRGVTALRQPRPTSPFVVQHRACPHRWGSDISRNPNSHLVFGHRIDMTSLLCPGWACNAAVGRCGRTVCRRRRYAHRARSTGLSRTMPASPAYFVRHLDLRTRPLTGRCGHPCSLCRPRLSRASRCVFGVAVTRWVTERLMTQSKSDGIAGPVIKIFEPRLGVSGGNRPAA
jgi:hypothetical protein